MHYYNPKGTKMRNNRNEISNERLREICPAVFAEGQHDSRSSRYSMVPTIEVVNALRDSGWVPVSARQSRVRDKTREGFQKHELRFADKATVAGSDSELRVGDSVVEFVLGNSHDGSSSYIGQAGLYRGVCANGLLVCETMFEKVSIKHQDFDPQSVIDVTSEMVNDVPQIAEAVEGYQQFLLPDQARTAFAEAAAMIRFDLEPEDLALAPVSPQMLLNPRRQDDTGNDLWRTLNVIQENVIKGGQLDRTRRNPNGKRHKRTRAVKSIDLDHRLNSAMFHLAEQIYQTPGVSLN